MSKDNKVYTIFIVILHILVIFILIFIAFLIVKEEICNKNEISKAYKSVEDLNDNNSLINLPNILIAEKVWRIMEVERNGKKDWIPVLVDDDEWRKA